MARRQTPGMTMDKTPITEAFWAEFRAATGVEAGDYTVVAFGDSGVMADELAWLVLSGVKRATAALLRDFTSRDEPLPRRGDYVVVVDRRHIPRCIWRTTEVSVKPFIEVDDAFAWDEGEGDRTRHSWLVDHRRYFARQAEREGFIMTDGIETVFERFEVVWPAGIADDAL